MASRDTVSEEQITWMRYVKCIPTRDMMLLECDAWYSRERENVFCYHARVRCTNDQRVKNISATVSNALHSVKTVVVSWEQNTTVEEPTSFEIECRNSHYSLVTSVSHHRTTSQLMGLLPSSSYTCCVSAVYEDIGYIAQGICTEIKKI